MLKNFLIPISRRDLLKFAGLTAAGAVLSSNDHAQAAPTASNQNVALNADNIPVQF